MSGEDQPTLPGLAAEPADAAGRSGVVESAARQTLAALRAGGRLDAETAVMSAALVTAARQLDRASTSPRAKDYGVANLLAQLRETYLVLNPRVEGGGGLESAFEQLARELGSEAALRDGAGRVPQD